MPVSGEAALEPGVCEAARILERAGFDSLWVIDHIVMPRIASSRYPFSDDGRIPWPPRQPFLDAISASSAIAAVTTGPELGTAVMVLPLREPVTVAKQIATIDVLSGGRFVLGVGAGWLQEEIDALGVNFRNRGARLSEALALMRACWTGEPGRFDGKHYSLPDGIMCFPRPLRQVPVLIGGNSAAAIRRSGLMGDGWLGLAPVEFIRYDNVSQQRAHDSRSHEGSGATPRTGTGGPQARSVTRQG